VGIADIAPIVHHERQRRLALHYLHQHTVRMPYEPRTQCVVTRDGGLPRGA
jgi:hypothetical protein